MSHEENVDTHLHPLMRLNYAVSEKGAGMPGVSPRRLPGGEIDELYGLSIVRSLDEHFYILWRRVKSYPGKLDHP